MLTRTINGFMRHSKLWKNCSETCRRAFIREMQGMQYGGPQCLDAFNWFVTGWRAADVQRLSDTCSQINTDVEPLNGSRCGLFG